jgi:hypothetical protein
MYNNNKSVLPSFLPSFLRYQLLLFIPKYTLSFKLKMGSVGLDDIDSIPDNKSSSSGLGLAFEVHFGCTRTSTAKK